MISSLLAVGKESDLVLHWPIAYPTPSLGTRDASSREGLARAGLSEDREDLHKKTKIHYKPCCFSPRTYGQLATCSRLQKCLDKKHHGPYLLS